MYHNDVCGLVLNASCEARSRTPNKTKYVSKYHPNPPEESRDINHNRSNINTKLPSQAGARHHCSGITLRVQALRKLALRVTEALHCAPAQRNCLLRVPRPSENFLETANSRKSSCEQVMTNFLAAQLHVKSIESNETLHGARYDKYLDYF